MTKLKPYISLFAALVIAFGVTASSIHMHDDNANDFETEHVLVEEELICIVCGSIFKFNDENLSSAEIVDTPDAHTFFTSFELAINLSGTFKDGRAPPFFG